MDNQEVALFALGILFVQLFVKGLKKIFRQARPTNVLDTYGMPSSRAAIVFFIVTYLALRIRHLKRNTFILLLLVALASCALKYYMREHTLVQLLAGSAVGITIAYILNMFLPYLQID